jgi:hypothetical protein
MHTAHGQLLWMANDFHMHHTHEHLESNIFSCWSSAQQDRHSDGIGTFVNVTNIKALVRIRVGHGKATNALFEI